MTAFFFRYIMYVLQVLNLVLHVVLSTSTSTAVLVLNLVLGIGPILGIGPHTRPLA